MLIFLDIDGVMVPAKSWERPQLLPDGMPMFNRKAIVALNKIITETNADVILTTSHKSRYSPQEWVEIFGLRGIDINNINLLPNNSNNQSRKDELLNYFETRQINDDFIIIDDDNSLNGLPSKIKDRLILTSGTVGLTNELAKRAITLMNEVEVAGA